MESIRVLFVLPINCKNESDTSAIMQDTFKLCQKKELDPQWIKENDTSWSFSKTDLAVFDSFEGDYFTYIKANFKCVRIVGPRCLLTCLKKECPVPNFPWPILNVAMKDTLISCSYLPKEQKKDIQHKVQTMGGSYTTDLVGMCTHLITNSVKSDKYIKAAENGLKLMLPSYIEDVWNESQSTDVDCNDERFEKHKCLPFHNLIICSSGATASIRSALIKMVKENGGKFEGSLNLKTTDVLVCYGAAGTTSDKFKAAKKAPGQVHCVTPEWITDSINKGYALLYKDYEITAGTSTPVKEGINPNFSTISVIPGPHQELSVLQQTVDDTAMPFNTNTPNKLKRKLFSEEHNDLIDEINMKNVKLAGPFLDGCSVYIVGFGSEQREKLSKILNFSGATRYDTISDRVTHIIVGDASCTEVKKLHSKEHHAVMLTVHWLIDSLHQKQPVSEGKYIVKAPDASGCDSPLSKKGLHLLRVDNTIVEKNVEEKENRQINGLEIDSEMSKLQQYFSGIDQNEGTLLPPADKQIPITPSVQRVAIDGCNSEMSEYTSEIINIFEGLLFAIVGFDEEQTLNIKEHIEELSGSVVVSKKFKGVPHYTVLPAFPTELPRTESELVNDLWITECYQDRQVYEIAYYHKPFVSKDHKALEGLVVTISGYQSYERNFLRCLVNELGAIEQEMLSKVKKNTVLVNTHLVCSEPSGKKYDAAKKWKIATVVKEWLLECALKGCRVAEGEFLVETYDATKQRSTLAELMSKPSLVNEGALDTSSGEGKLAGQASVHEVTRQGSSFALGELSTKPSFVNEGAADASLGEGTFVGPASIHEAFKEPSALDESLAKQSLVNEGAAGAASSDENTPIRPAFLRKVGTAANQTPGVCSQVTPINKLLEGFRQKYGMELPTPDTPDILKKKETPKEPLGACFRANPSPELRKRCRAFIDSLPEHKPWPERRKSTPLSELKRQLWDKLLHKDESQNVDEQQKIEQPNFDDIPDDDVFTGISAMQEPEPQGDTLEAITPQKKIEQQLQKLEEMVASSGSGRRSSRKRFEINEYAPVAEHKSSQKCTVEWDYSNADRSAARRVFMVSGLTTESKTMILEQLRGLGAEVSDLSCYDPDSTHLLCIKPTTNEKSLAHMAAGKWILHVSYVQDSINAGKFLDEELYEFGNPKALPKIIPSITDADLTIKMEAIHWWRKEVSRRGYGAFHDLRAIIVAKKRDHLVRVVTAGGGMVIDAEPPFSEDVYATHCLLELKSVSRVSDYEVLAQRGVYCIDTYYIHQFLLRKTDNALDHALPFFSKYYEHI